MKRLASTATWWQVRPTGLERAHRLAARRIPGGQPRDTIGVDLHKRESQLCVLTDAGVVTERRIVTSRARFTAVLGDRPPARILLEASTESEWVARYLEGLGHTVIVADPNYAPMYVTRTRRVKTDKRDARTLAEALRLGAYRAAHRLSPERRHVRAELAVREALVRTRTDHRIDGDGRRGRTTPDGGLDRADHRRGHRRDHRRDDRRRDALSLRAPVRSVLRIGARRTQLGREAPMLSVGRSTKAGNSRARYLLVEAAWRILRSKDAGTAALRVWALAIAARRGTPRQAHRRGGTRTPPRRRALRDVARPPRVRCDSPAYATRARGIAEDDRDDIG